MASALRLRSRPRSAPSPSSLALLGRAAAHDDRPRDGDLLARRRLDRGLVGHELILSARGDVDDLRRSDEHVSGPGEAQDLELLLAVDDHRVFEAELRVADD